MQKEVEKFKNSTILEGMVSIRGLLLGQKSCNDRKILHIYYDEGNIKKIGKEIAFLRHEGERQGFDVLPLPYEKIKALAVGTSHGGILAECSDRTQPPLTDEMLEGVKFAVMIEGIEDPYNFGYAIRSLYACGVDLLILSKRNWMSAAGVVARSSAGASEQIKIAVASSEDAVFFMKNAGFEIVCADANADEAVEDADFHFPLFLVVGGERRGISQAIMQSADRIVRLTYGRPFPAALSAASAASILGYEIARKMRE